MSYLFVRIFDISGKGVGKKVNRRELMSIASVENNDDHVIWVNKYDTLKEAIEKAVDMKIGRFNNCLVLQGVRIFLLDTYNSCI